MKVLLYSEGMKYISQSGIGKALSHQKKALALNNVEFTTDIHAKDVTLVHINTFGPKSFFLAKKAKHEGKKVIIHGHSTQEDFRDSFFFSNALAPLFKFWLKIMYSQADALITPTPYSKELLTNYDLGVPIHAVSNGIDLAQFEYSDEKRRDFRNAHSFSATDKIVLSVGLYIKRKGIIDFFNVAAMNPDIKFVWCGFTNPHLMTKEIKDLILDPPSNVYLLGYINSMSDAYSACDCFFMPTYEETEGIVVLEALASKRPIILRDIPVYDTWLRHNQTCFIGSTDEEFSYLIQSCLENKLPNLTEAGYSVVAERSLAKVGQQLNIIYQDTEKNDSSLMKKKFHLLHSFVKS